MRFPNPQLPGRELGTYLLMRTEEEMKERSRLLFPRCSDEMH
jgi:hypothetical protein